MTENEREKNEGRRPPPVRPETEPVSVPENGDFRYDQATEESDEEEEGPRAPGPP